MSKDPFMTMLDTCLKHVSDHAARADRLAYMLYQVTEGDVPDNIYETLEEYGYVDENHEWKYDEDEEEE